MLLRLPSWEVYVAVALDEVVAIGGASWQVRQRVEQLLTELVAIAPASRAEALRLRLERASEARRSWVHTTGRPPGP